MERQSIPLSSEREAQGEPKVPAIGESGIADEIALLMSDDLPVP